MSRIFEIFNEICQIPHGSGNMQMISEYCVDFALKNNFKYHKDEIDNVVIYVPGVGEYANAEPIILQGHMDMVCEKDDGVEFDFMKDPIKLIYNGDILTADGTTLGADNGIAVAMMFALAEDFETPRPPLELMLTVDEEIGLIGAAGIDGSLFKGKKLINIDSEDEGVITVGCAGGVRLISSIPVSKVKINESNLMFEIVLSGFMGGHSGIDINKMGGNASKIIGRFLRELSTKIEYQLVSLSGGGKDNVISLSSKAVVAVNASDASNLKQFVDDFKSIIIREYMDIESNINMEITPFNEASDLALSDESLNKITFVLQQIPNGIIKLNSVPFVDGQLSVDTSINTGSISFDDTSFTVTSLIRSGKMSRKDALAKKVTDFITWVGGEVLREGEYSSWEYIGETELLQAAKKVYFEMYDKEAKVEIIHAGLECGMLAPKFDNFDCISIGPDLKDVHTTSERISISSVNRVYKYIVKLIQSLS